jgi:hypothetical protein
LNTLGHTLNWVLLFQNWGDKMSLKDYAHWNEDAEYMWYMEEGRFSSEDMEPDYDERDFREYEEEDYDDE